MNSFRWALTVLPFTILLVAGCSGGNGKKSNVTEPDKGSETETQVSLFAYPMAEKIELTFMTERWLDYAACRSLR